MVSMTSDGDPTGVTRRLGTGEIIFCSAWSSTRIVEGAMKKEYLRENSNLVGSATAVTELFAAGSIVTNTMNNILLYLGCRNSGDLGNDASTASGDSKS